MSVWIHVETLTGEGRVFQFDESITIGQVQAKIQEYTNMPPDHFCIVARPLPEEDPEKIRRGKKHKSTKDLWQSMFGDDALLDSSSSDEKEGPFVEMPGEALGWQQQPLPNSASSSNSTADTTANTSADTSSTR